MARSGSTSAPADGSVSSLTIDVDEDTRSINVANVSGGMIYGGIGSDPGAGVGEFFLPATGLVVFDVAELTGSAVTVYMRSGSGASETWGAAACDTEIISAAFGA